MLLLLLLVSLPQVPVSLPCRRMTAAGTALPGTPAIVKIAVTITIADLLFVAAGFLPLLLLLLLLLN